MFYTALTPQYSNVPIFELVNEQTIFNLKTKKDEIKTKEENEWLGVGMPEISIKKIKTENYNPLIVRVKVFNGENHLNIPVSIDWDVNSFKMTQKLKHFLRKKEILTLKDFLDNFEKLYEKCPRNTMIELESLNHEISWIIYTKIHPKEVFLKIRKNIPGNRKRPTTNQRAFMNSLYFFNRFFNETEIFKKSVKIKAAELELHWVPVYPYIK